MRWDENCSFVIWWMWYEENFCETTIANSTSRICLNSQNMHMIYWLENQQLRKLVPNKAEVFHLRAN